MPTPPPEAAPGACRKCGSPLNGYGYDLSGYMHDPDSQACLRVQLTTLKDANARLLAVKQAAEPALIELMYLIEQAKCREGGSVVRAYENLRAALAAEAGE
jgi:hypothetical protein